MTLQIGDRVTTNLVGKLIQIHYSMNNVKLGMIEIVGDEDRFLCYANVPLERLRIVEDSEQECAAPDGSC